MDEFNNSMFQSNEDLKCAICDKYLSVPPVSHVFSVGYVCGRCQKKIAERDTSKPCERQSLYESIAKDMTLPCCYKPIGCLAVLKWDEVSKHESACFFRNTVCPLSEKNKQFLSLEEVCSWRGTNQKLIPHLFSSHRILFFNPPQTYLRPKFETTFFFTEVLNHVMMVIFYYDVNSNKFIIYVLANLTDIECNFFRYQIEVYDECRSVSVLLRRNKVEPLCDNIFKFNSINGLNFAIKKMSGILNNTKSFFVKVGICKKNKKDIKVLKSNLPHDSLLNAVTRKRCPPLEEGVLQEIECPVCNDYMVPPIFLCKAGHSVCNSCNSRVKSCPTCRSVMIDTRNFTLEKLTNLVNYPCKNRSSGCFFITSANKIREHEKTCPLTAKTCILKCLWIGNTLDMIIHLFENHTVLQIDDVQTIFLGSQKLINHEAVIYDNQVFLFNYSYGFKMPFNYNLYHLKADNSKYKYELVIVDRSENSLNLSLRHLCSLLLSTDKKDDCINGFSLPFELIQPLILEDRELIYKLKIVKVVHN